MSPAAQSSKVLTQLVQAMLPKASAIAMVVHEKKRVSKLAALPTTNLPISVLSMPICVVLFILTHRMTHI